MHFHSGKTLNAFENQYCSFKYVHIDPINDFCILVIPETIFQVGVLKFGSVGALNIMHIHRGKTLDCFENQHHSSINICIFTRLLIFTFWSVMKPFFQARIAKFGSVRALNTLINIIPGFCDNQKKFIFADSNSKSKIINLTKSKSMYQQDIINIQKRAFIVRRLLLWYNMYRFRESQPVNKNRQCINCHNVYPLP